MVGGCKGVDGDFRVLTPLGDWDPALATVQHLYGDERLLTPQANKPSKTPSQRCTLGPTPLVQGAKAPCRVAMGDAEWDDMVPLLVARGFLEPRHIKRRESGYEFTADNKGMDCPCCDNVHDRFDSLMSNVSPAFPTSMYSMY